MTDLQVFNNELFGSIRAVQVNDEIYFVGKDVAEALGYKDADQAIRKHVDMEDKLTRRFDGSGQNRNMTVINESGLYSLIFGSKLDTAKQFKKWVTSEVLPTIRRSGCYITEKAEQETIDYQAKFGIRRIRNTFREAVNPRETYNEFCKLSLAEAYANHIDNKERIKASNIIIDELENKVANNLQTLRPSELLAISELINDIQNDIIHLNNKYYGGVIANKTREINELTHQVEELKPIERSYTTLDYHGFSNNYMYSHTSYGVYRSHSYNNWIDNFPIEEIPTKEEYEMYEGIDFTKPIGVDIRYVCKPSFDCENLNKSLLDMIFNRCLEVDDSIVMQCTSTKVGTCRTYDEGKIFFAIYNIAKGGVR